MPSLRQCPHCGEVVDELRAMTLEEIAALYELIAEGKTLEALELIYNEVGFGDELLAPKTQMRIVALRRAA